MTYFNNKSTGGPKMQLLSSQADEKLVSVGRVSSYIFSQLLSDPSLDNWTLAVDYDSLAFLSNKKVINWCNKIMPVFPIKTPGDGNCLLHAISLAVRGYTDSDSSGFLRSQLYDLLTQETCKDEFRRRWQNRRERLDSSIPGGGISYTQEEWDNEWALLVKAADASFWSYNVMSGFSYDFLEEIHVFVVANALRRPVIIVADPFVCDRNGEQIETNNLRGIYLPLLWDPLDCYTCPIVLAFMIDHFLPLLFRERTEADRRANLTYAVPLVTASQESLYTHFLLPDEEAMVNSILKKYLVPSEMQDQEYVLPVATIPEECFMNMDNYPNKCFYAGCQWSARYWLRVGHKRASEMEANDKVKIYSRPRQRSELPEVEHKSQICLLHATVLLKRARKGLSSGKVKLESIMTSFNVPLKYLCYNCVMPAVDNYYYCRRCLALFFEDSLVFANSDSVPGRASDHASSSTYRQSRYTNSCEQDDYKSSAKPSNSTNAVLSNDFDQETSLSSSRTAETREGDVPSYQTITNRSKRCIGPSCNESGCDQLSGLCTTCYNVLRIQNEKRWGKKI